MIGKIESFLKTYSKVKSRQGRSTAIRRWLSYLYPDRVPVPQPGEPVHMEPYETVAAEYLGEVKAGTRSLVNDLSGFVGSMADMSPMAIHGYTAGAIAFLEFHGFDLAPADRKRIRRRAPPNRAITEDAAITAEGIRKILEFSTPQMRALIMMLASSGCRLGEALQIGVSDLDLDSTPAAVHIRREISKNKLPRITYVTSEAAAVLRVWLKHRPTYIRNKPGPRENRTQADDPRLFPLNDSAASDQFILACKKAGLHEVDRNSGKATVHLHSLRKWFRSNLTKAGGNAIDITERLMGHVGGYLAGSYVRIPEPEVARFYRENEHFLFIAQGTMSEADREKLGTLAEENVRLEKKVSRLEKMAEDEQATLSDIRKSPVYLAIMKDLRQV